MIIRPYSQLISVLEGGGSPRFGDQFQKLNVFVSLIVSKKIFLVFICLHVLQHSFENYHAHKIQAFMQSLMGVVESSLHNVYCPLGGLVMLAALWNKAFQQVSQRVYI